MNRKGPRKASVDDALLRALKQLADETLAEEVPERLLEVIRGAESRHAADGAAPSADDADAEPEPDRPHPSGSGRSPSE